MSEIKLKLKGAGEYSILQAVSFLYISIPTIIFILGWLKPAYSIPLTLLTMYGLFLSIKSGWDFEFKKKEVSKISEPAVSQQAPSAKGKNIKAKNSAGSIKKPKQVESGMFDFLNKPVIFHLLTIVLVIIAVLYSGVGGYAIQDGDYLKHNGFFLDLTKYSWPLAYAKTGPDDAPRMINTYLGYYLPSALLGKMFGFSFAYFASFVWACLGLYLTLNWISMFLSKRAVIYLVMFVFFGELAYFGWEKYFPATAAYGKSYNYANWMLYESFQSKILNGVFWILGSNHTFLANGPHHIFPSWVCILMIFHDSVFRKSTDRIGFIFSFIPYVSAFMAIGLGPFMILSAIQNKFRKFLSIQNLVIAPLLIVIAGLYLTSNNALFEKGWIWNYINLSDAAGYLFMFFLLSFGLYFIVMPKRAVNFHDASMLPWLYTSIGCIVLFSFYRIGKYMDFPIKAYNPSWIIFQVCVITSISYSKKLSEKIRSGIVIVLICIASIGAFSNFKFASRSKLFTHKISEQNITHVNYIGPKEESLALFSDGKSFFWRTLAKTPEYTNN